MAIMRTSRGPRRVKEDRLELRISDLEKEAFKKAADLAGVPMSTWVRETYDGRPSASWKRPRSRSHSFDT